MSWVGLDDEQMVSYTDASSCPFALVAGQSNTTSNQCMDKSAILSKYVVNSSKMAGYANNQLVPKKEWETTVSLQLSLYTCGGQAITGYAATNVLTIGVKLYRDAQLRNSIYWDWDGDGVEDTRYAYNGNIHTVNSSGAIISISACTVAYPIYVSTQSSTSPATACSYVNTQLLWCSTPTITYDSILYTDQNLTIPFNGLSRYWLSGSDAYRINGTGVVYLIVNC